MPIGPFRCGGGRPRVGWGVVRSLVLVALVACSSAVACSPAASHPDAPTSAWSLGPAMPRRALDAGVASFGLRVAVAGGFDGVEITPRVDTFSAADNAWSALPDAPVRWTSINVAAVGTTLFLLGGLEGADRVASGEGFALDPESTGWQTIPPMPEARGGSGVVTAPGRVYLLGGVSSTGALASCLAYDTIEGSWTQLPDLPAPRAHPAAMRRPDGTLIVAGGFESVDASQPRGEVWALLPGAQSWQLRSAPERVARGGCAYGAVLGQLICAGGEGSPAASTLVESYDSYADVWIEGEAMPVARASAQGAALDARLFVPGGAGAPGMDPTDTLYIYAPLDTAPR
jgi:hypothetical protein